MSEKPLMTLGLFVFALNTVPFETVKRATAQRWAGSDRVGQGPAHQWVGPGADSITIDGVLMPELTGGPVTLDRLRAMADSGKAWILLSGTGDHLGKWFIESVDETRSHHAGPGLARKIAFTLKLVRYWDDGVDQLGAIMESLP